MYRIDALQVLEDILGSIEDDSYEEYIKENKEDVLDSIRLAQDDMLSING